MKKILLVLALLIHFGSKVNAQQTLFTQDFSDKGVQSDYFYANHSDGFGNAIIDLFQRKFDYSFSNVCGLKTSPNRHFLGESSITDDTTIERKLNKLSNSQKPFNVIKRVNFNALSIPFEVKGYTEMSYYFVRPS